MKAITIRLTETQLQQIEKFANEKRTTITDALRFAAFSFLDSNSKQQKENQEHERTREQIAAQTKFLVEVLEKFSAQTSKQAQAIYNQVAPKQTAVNTTNGGKQ